MKFYLSACGEGFGHSSRMAAVYYELKKRGDDAVVATYGSALERLKKIGVKTFETSPEFKMVGKNGKLDFLNTAFATASSSRKYLHALSRETKKIRQMGAKAVISDSRIISAIAGYRLNLPVFYVANQTAYADTDATDFELYAIGKIMSGPLTIPVEFSDVIAIPDFGPPDTVCLPILSKDIKIKKRTKFFGPMSLALQKGKKAEWKPKKPKVLISMGGQAFREESYQKLLQEAKKHKGFDFLVSSMFAKKDENYENVKVRRFLKDLLPWQRAADYLVMPAGHSAIMEGIILQKPMLLIPDASQPEQISNAKRCKELGVGEYLDIMHIGQAGNKLEQMSKKRGKYLKNLSKLSKLAKSEQDGAANIVEEAKEFVQRIDY